MLADDVADVVDHDALLVLFLQFLKEPERRMIQGVSMSGISYHTWQQFESEAYENMSHSTPGKIQDTMTDTKVRKAGTTANTFLPNLL